MPRRSRLTLALTALLMVTGCGGDPGAAPGAESSPAPTARATPASPSTPAPTPAPTSAPTSAGSPSRSPRPRLVRGVDASHHQGDIEWRRVRRDGIEFAYLKASEGRTFLDPRFVSNARAAEAAGLRVGGYHYFSTCSPGAPQAEHFLEALASAGDAATALPPAIDLELLGNCADPPPRTALLGQVRTFLRIVERATGQRLVVYAYPDFEARYRFAPELDRRQWVRRIGGTPPAREWWIWQRDDRASVDGFATPADLNLMRAGR